MGKKKHIKKSKHDRVIYDIKERLENSTTLYDMIESEEKFITKDKRDGEIDLYALYKANNEKKYLLLFEVKTTDNTKNYKKAYQQLTKDKAHFGRLYNADRVFMFYVYGTHKNQTDYKIERVK